MNEKEILENFSIEEMAGLLTGAQIRTKKDEELIVWLMAERERLSKEIQEKWGFR